MPDIQQKNDDEKLQLYTENLLRNLEQCCNDASGHLGRLLDQLAKIIEAKKKSSGSAGGSMMLRQAKDILDTIANLQMIGEASDSARKQINQLDSQLQKMLSQQFGQRAAVGLGLGGAAEKEEEEKGSGGGNRGEK